MLNQYHNIAYFLFAALYFFTSQSLYFGNIKTFDKKERLKKNNPIQYKTRS